MSARPRSWSYGVLTVPSRFDVLLPQTVKSLVAAGFDRPRLFVDASLLDCPLLRYDSATLGHLQATFRGPPVRTAGNWILALHELLVREPQSERYALFQDDILAIANLRRYLEVCPFPQKGYLNLYTFPNNLEGHGGQTGWFIPPHFGLSALGLVFDREGVLRLLSDYQLVAKPTDVHNGWRNIDGSVYRAMKRADYQEYCHYPSLLSHTGQRSAMGNQPYPQDRSFPGESFDALDLLKSPPSPS